MRLISKLLILLFFSACASKPTPMVYEQWQMQPASADQDLALDDQFLKKSQKSGQLVDDTDSPKRKHLNP